MADHDPYCPLLDMRPETIGIQQSCLRALIAKVRSDEQKQRDAMQQAIDTLLDQNTRYARERNANNRALTDLRVQVKALLDGPPLPEMDGGEAYTQAILDVLTLIDRSSDE